MDTPNSETQPLDVKVDRQALEARHTALTQELNSWLPTWREIAENMRPRALRDKRSDANRGTKKHQKIINFTPLEAVRTLASGMMAGITSPSRPWFRLTLRAAPELLEQPDVKQWLVEVEKRIRETLAKSNVYKGLHLVYLDLGPFGTSALLLDEDDEDDVRAYVFPIGSYRLATGPRGDVEALTREFSPTVDQLAKMFGKDALSASTRRLVDEKRFDQRVDVVHAILPNEDYSEGKLGAAGKRWLSCWWEKSSTEADRFLRISGYEEFPVMAPRWEVTGEDVYGAGPGYAALGDCKALQLTERRAAQAADKHISPPMSAPASASTTPISLLPGEVNYVDGLGAGQALRPAVQPDPRAIEVLAGDRRELEKRIRKAFFADLWLLLSESEGTMTAREVSERREEKLLQLGTVLEALQDELLDPLITRVFNILLRRGRFPPVPKVLQGLELSIEYVSIMAQAQKLLSTTGLERYAAFAGNLAQLKPDVLDKVDMDQLVDEYADALGIPPSTVRADADVQRLRSQRAAQQQQQQQLAAAAEGAKTAKTLGDTSLESGNALTEMLRGVGAR